MCFELRFDEAEENSSRFKKLHETFSTNNLLLTLFLNPWFLLDFLCFDFNVLFIFN